MRFPLSLLFPTLLCVALPAQLAGTYTVGSGGSYPNLAAAIGALTSLGVSAPVNFLVLANDAGPWTIGAFPGQGAGNPVVFDAVGPITLSGPQPVLTLSGCAAVTFRGFRGTFAATPSTFVVNAGTTDCVFAACDFRAATSTSSTTGAALFNLVGGTGLRIEDSTIGGGYEALYAQVGNDGTTVQRCRILGGGFWILRIAGPNFVLANNFITGTSHYGISAGISGNSGSATNLKILHNSIHIDHTATVSQYCSLRWYSGAAGTEVLNNVFVDNYPAATATGFNVWCYDVLRPALMNYNCFWRNQPNTFPVYAGANRTLAAWQGLGFDQNGIQADPRFVAPGATPADLSLQVGSPCSIDGTLLPLVATDIFSLPRTAPVSIGAHEEDSGALYRTFGAGCAGSFGIPTNTASAPPRIGMNSVITFGNLSAPHLAIAMIGASNTASAFGALPVDLASYGAPGCFGRVSPDATVVLLGAGGTASFTFSTPAAPLFGFTFYTQALALDPWLNALGASTSNAATAVVGY